MLKRVVVALVLLAGLSWLSILFERFFRRERAKQILNSQRDAQRRKATEKADAPEVRRPGKQDGRGDLGK